MNKDRFSYLDELKKKSEFILNASNMERAVINAMMTEECKRVTKLLNYVLANQRSLSEEELAYMLNTSTTTVRRDAEKLRRLGISIHSRKRVFEILNDHLIK